MIPSRYGDDDLDVMEEEEGEAGQEDESEAYEEGEEGEEEEEGEEDERQDNAVDPAPTRSPSASITLQLMYTAEGYVPEHFIGSIETSSIPGAEFGWMAQDLCALESQDT